MTTYRSAGVDVEEAARHVGRISGGVTSTWGPQVVGDFGGFAAGVEVPDGYANPLLMMTTDGVGTKLELARRAGRWDGVGQDLVAMVVDDLAAVGARPLGLVDYMAVGALDPVRDEAIVASIARACSVAGCPLLGGETAEHPGVMDPGAVDLAATAMGIVDREAMLGPGRVEEGDLVIGLYSPNLRSNGFSLVRALFEEGTDDNLDVLLQPSVIYSPAVLEAMSASGVKSAAHITGGGLKANLARALPDGLHAEIDFGAWQPPAVFDLVADLGVSTDEMRRTFNMGIGFCLVISSDALDRVATPLVSHDPRPIGRIISP